MRSADLLVYNQGLDLCFLFQEGTGLALQDVSRRHTPAALTATATWAAGHGGGRSISFATMPLDGRMEYMGVWSRSLSAEEHMGLHRTMSA